MLERSNDELATANTQLEVEKTNATARVDALETDIANLQDAQTKYESTIEVRMPLRSNPR